jgi:hypothetical protein
LIANAFGNLITLNAFSVDDSQQFNKEAYLDLSKPYKQKNPQSATKKDNQATTILKEVAGTARTALGSKLARCHSKPRLRRLCLDLDS